MKNIQQFPMRIVRSYIELSSCSIPRQVGYLGRYLYLWFLLVPRDWSRVFILFFVNVFRKLFMLVLFTKPFKSFKYKRRGPILCTRIILYTRGSTIWISSNRTSQDCLQLVPARLIVHFRLPSLIQLLSGEMIHNVRA